MDEAAARQFWHGLRDCALPFFTQQPLWRLSLPSTAPLAALGSEPLIDWGGALRWYGGLAEATDVRAAAAASGGTRTVLARPGAARAALPPLVRGHPRGCTGG